MGWGVQAILLPKTVNENRLKKYSCSSTQSSETATGDNRVAPNLELRTITILAATTDCGEHTVKWRSST